MPSRNIACLLYHDVLRCDIYSGLHPKPSGTCEFDWSAIEMGVATAARPGCVSDAVGNDRYPVLAYGQTWGRSGIACVSRTTGLRCRSEAGHGFSLAREGWTVS